jgi:ApaG protein
MDSYRRDHHNAPSNKTRRKHTMPNPEKYRIEIKPVPQFIPEQSDPDDSRYVFAYTITIRNLGELPAQLIARHWIITDANNEVQEVRGLGVVGNQPLLKPGESFEYSSGCSLATPVGTMKGTYQMVGEDGTRFEAEIPEFVLAIPRVLH